MRLRSLRSRLTIGILAVLVPVLLVGGAYVARDSDRAERQSLDDRIQRTAELLDQAALAVLNGELEETADERERLNRLLSATRSTLIVRFAGFNYYERGMPLKGIGNTPSGSRPAPPVVVESGSTRRSSAPTTPGASSGCSRSPRSPRPRRDRTPSV